jgi:hypothetical protein
MHDAACRHDVIPDSPMPVSMPTFDDRESVGHGHIVANAKGAVEIYSDSEKMMRAEGGRIVTLARDDFSRTR